MTRCFALAGTLFLLAGCAGGAKPEDPAPGGVPAEAAAAPAPEEKPSGEAVARDALEKGAALEKQGRGSDAAVLYKEALGRDDVPTELRAKLSLRLAHRLAENGHWDAALGLARDAKKLRPDWDDAAVTVARLEKRQAEKTDAEAMEKVAGKKHRAKGEGSVEDRLARLEDQVARMAEKWEAASKGGGAPAGKEREKVSGAEQEAQALREKLLRMHTEFEDQRAALKHHLEVAETERETLQKRVHALENECSALRAENEKLRAGK